ncbi:hypothetical protein [Chitinophaga sp. MM2321]|uniref:hypothetical protein n=1 Tax=Chitinophaga sp. MM2321 TaxID=3137178 RepID=UPI0032D57643
MRTQLPFTLFVLSILLWGCASRNAVPLSRWQQEQVSGSHPVLLLTLILLIISLSLFLFLGWVILLRNSKALQIAQINLLQQELKAASLVSELREVSEKYQVLEDELHDAQHQLRKGKNSSRGSGHDPG